MTQDLLAVDDHDHELASGAFKRITSKSAIALEAMVDRLAIKGIDSNTPVPDVLNIANFMAKVSSAPEQSKRDLPDVGDRDTGPRITLVIGGETWKGGGAGEKVVTGRVVDDEDGEDAVLDGEWGLV